jgi:hypothetical protein
LPRVADLHGCENLVADPRYVDIRCDERWERDAVAQAFMARLDRSSVSTERYQETG